MSGDLGSGFDFGVASNIACAMIRKFGVQCTLRRETVSGSGVWIDRLCWAAFPDWSPLERMGTLVDPLDRLALVSTEGLVVPPNQHLDLLVTWDRSGGGAPVILEQLKITRPPGRLAPGPGAGNQGIIYWELHCRGARGVGVTA